jgi:hypothetical protein
MDGFGVFLANTVRASAATVLHNVGSKLWAMLLYHFVTVLSGLRSTASKTRRI